MKREDLSGKAERLKTESSALMDQAQDTNRKLQGTKRESGTRNVDTVQEAFLEP